MTLRVTHPLDIPHRIEVSSNLKKANAVTSVVKKKNIKRKKERLETLRKSKVKNHGLEGYIRRDRERSRNTLQRKTTKKGRVLKILNF
jgi:hypothetical protein